MKDVELALKVVHIQATLGFEMERRISKDQYRALMPFFWLWFNGKGTVNALT